MIENLKASLPRPTLKKKTVVHRQGVAEIMQDVVKAHSDYAGDYDLIASYFWKGSEKETIRFIFDFCKKYLPYKAETDRAQTVRSPAAILETAGTWGVDCKHYAGFIGGVLDALNRQGKNFDWRYRFVSYTPEDSTPEHVFIAVDIDGKTVYVDPVLKKLNERFPKYYYFQEKFPMLSRVNGVAMVNPFEYNITNFVTSNTGGGGSAVQTTVPSEGSVILPGVNPPGGGQKFMLWLEKNWLVALAVVAVGAYVITKKK